MPVNAASPIAKNIPDVLIGEYGGGALIHSPFGVFMCDRSEANVLRNTSAGTTLNFLQKKKNLNLEH